jgi:hypothetical protein
MTTLARLLARQAAREWLHVENGGYDITGSGSTEARR